MTTDDTMPLPVAIVGAGIGGLTREPNINAERLLSTECNNAVARILSLKKIPVIVYETKPKGEFGNHGLWLGEKATQALAAELQVSTGDIRKHTAVTAEDGDANKNSQKSSGMRVNKRRLLDYLITAGIDVRWNHHITGVRSGGSEDSVTLVYKVENSDTENEQKYSGIVGADGVHSTIRTTTLPDVKSNLLPYVAINGQKRTPFAQYHEEHASEDYQDTVSHKKGSHQTHLCTGLNDIKAGKAYSFFTYSRPARETGDALFKPNRSTTEANTIPDEFYGEVQASSFSDKLNKEAMKDVKLLSWLMRSIGVSSQEIAALPERVTLIGDAIHATPILGGDGGEQAIQDAAELGELLSAAYASDKVGQAMREFQAAALQRWQNSVKDSVRRLEEMHSQSEKL